MTPIRWVVAGGVTVVVVVSFALIIFLVSSSNRGGDEVNYQTPSAPAPVSATAVIEQDYNELVAQSIKIQTESFVESIDPDANLQDMTVTRRSTETSKTIYDIDLPASKQNFVAIVEKSVDGYNNPSVRCPEGDEKKYNTPCVEHYHD